MLGTLIVPYTREEWAALSDEERGPCELWDGRANRDGYGVRGRRFGTTLVHRQTWIETHGVVPAGLNVLHHCDNPPCRNVEHLFVGSQADNLADMTDKGRRRNWQSYLDQCSKCGSEFAVLPNGRRMCRPCQVERQRAWGLARKS